jgi:hypothetical protein
VVRRETLRTQDNAGFVTYVVRPDGHVQLQIGDSPDEENDLGARRLSQNGWRR